MEATFLIGVVVGFFLGMLFSLLLCKQVKEFVKDGVSQALIELQARKPKKKELSEDDDDANWWKKGKRYD